jgi:transcriptional regulator with XRE-family HTH domain
MEIGTKIRKMRVDKGLTQEELAGRICLTRSAVAKWENNIGYPDIVSLRDLSKEFGVSIDSLLSDNDLVEIKEENKKKGILLKVLIGVLFGLSIVGIFFSIFTAILMTSMEPDYLKGYFAISVGVTVVLLVLSTLLISFAMEDKKDTLLVESTFLCGSIGVPLFFIGFISMIQRLRSSVSPDVGTILVLAIGVAFLAGAIVSFIFERKHRKSLVQ